MRLWFILLFFCCFSALYSENQILDKIYVEKNQVAIQNDKFFVFVNEKWEPVDALFSDAYGIYVDGRKWYEPWECSYCGAMNIPIDITCWNCHR